jgi:predicted nucleotide-binding protein
MANNSEFYHVQIELKRHNRQGNIIKYHELDKIDRKEIIESIVVPFIQGKEFQIDGHFVSKKEIDRFCIKKTIKTTSELAKYENDRVPPGVIVFVFPQDILEYERHIVDVTKDFLAEAENLIQKADKEVNKDSKKNTALSVRVFIVHGHDDAAKQEVARFVENLGLKAIILSEQVNKGNTIIEKIEEHSDVGFGIVIYTPCDFGRESSETELKPRARQNVVFEHGFLIGKIGRERVHALVKGDIEKPNDISGVVYTPMDNMGGWKFMIAKEMKSLGYKIDLNKLVK